MAAAGADLMVETLRGLQAGTIHPRPQDDVGATLAPILKKEDGRIDFHLTAQEILNRLRGFQPWPGAYTSFRGKNLHVWAAQPVERALAAGEIVVERWPPARWLWYREHAGIARSTNGGKETHASGRFCSWQFAEAR